MRAYVYIPDEITPEEIELNRLWRIRFCIFLFALLALVLLGDIADAQTITAQPTNVSVPAGQTAVFTISVTGGPCESVWYSSSSLIGNHYGPGDSASPISYSIPNTTTAMNGATVQAIIYGCAGGSAEPLSTTAILTVTPSAPLTGITISPSSPTIPVGSLEQFTATGTYSDGSTQTVAATWTSDTPSVATVNQGIVTAIGVGTANISATFGGFTASTPVTVNLSNVTLPLNTTANTNGKANSAFVFDTGAAILPGSIVINQTAGSTTLPAGTITSDANGNLSGSLTINPNPQYLDANGNVVLTFGLSIIPNVINYPVPASQFLHGATGLTLAVTLYKSNLDIKAQTIGFTP
jgi:hypothetical protein